MKDVKVKIKDLVECINKVYVERNLPAEPTYMPPQN